MRVVALAVPCLLLGFAVMVAGQEPARLDEAAAGRFAALALDCVHKEYPNKIAHVHDRRPGRASAARTDAGLLRLLRLALVGARPLAAGAARPDVSRRRRSPRRHGPRWRRASRRSTSPAK